MQLGYSDDATRAFGLSRDGPVGTPFLGAAVSDADTPRNPSLLTEHPDQPRPPITVENVNSVMGKDSKKKVGAKQRAPHLLGTDRVWPGFGLRHTLRGRQQGERSDHRGLHAQAFAKVSGSRVGVPRAWFRSLDTAGENV